MRRGNAFILRTVRRVLAFLSSGVSARRMARVSSIVLAVVLVNVLNMSKSSIASIIGQLNAVRPPDQHIASSSRLLLFFIHCQYARSVSSYIVLFFFLPSFFFLFTAGKKADATITHFDNVLETMRARLRTLQSGNSDRKSTRLNSSHII